MIIKNRLAQYLKTYLLTIAIFTFYRMILFFTELTEFSKIQENAYEMLLKAFIMGLRFDSVIFCYFFALLVILRFVFDILKINSSWWRKLVFCTFSLCFTISMLDIPQFNYNFSRMNVSFFAWFDQLDIIIPMVASEIQYVWATIPFLILTLFYWKSLKRIFKDEVKLSRIKTTVLHLVLLVVLVVLSRGRFESKSPIRIGTAYFSSNALINQLGLNPVFTLLKTSIDHFKRSGQKIKAPEDYKEIVYSALKRDAKDVIKTYNEKPIKKNIVLIIMESMSANKMSYFGNPNKLTPFLDDLFLNSLSYENAYTTGIHTFNGIYSSLFSLPAILDKHPMKVFPIPRLNSIPKELKRNGYHNIYFTTHDKEFDNVSGFLTNNHFDEIVSIDDYPSDKKLTSLGVPDDYLFEYGVQKLSKLKSPFFATFMTVSDHGPYKIPNWVPEEFSGNTIKEQIVQYADWSLKKFFTLVKNEPWYKDTIFVLVADHGASLDRKYSVPLSYLHTPLIFFDPTKELIKNNVIKKEFVSQVDILPSIISLLKLPHTNSTLGIDIFSLKRDFVFFNSDQKVGVLNNDSYMIYDGKDRYSYDYKSRSTEDSAQIKKKDLSEYRKKVNSLLKFTAEDLIGN